MCIDIEVSSPGFCRTWHVGIEMNISIFVCTVLPGGCFTAYSMYIYLLFFCFFRLKIDQYFHCHDSYAFPRLIEAYPAASSTEDDGRELGPEWRAWIDHCLRYVSSHFTLSLIWSKTSGADLSKSENICHVETRPVLSPSTSPKDKIIAQI